MASPLQNYEPIDMGARKDPDLKRSPEKFFWGVFSAGVGIGLISAVFYVLFSDNLYSGVIRAVTVAAFLGIVATTIFRSVSRSR